MNPSEPKVTGPIVTSLFHYWRCPHPNIQVRCVILVFLNVGASVKMLWNVRWVWPPFRTYWSSALTGSPSGSGPYLTTGGGRWDAARSNRECWWPSGVCRGKYIIRVKWNHTLLQHVRSSGPFMIRMLITAQAAFVQHTEECNRDFKHAE